MVTRRDLLAGSIGYAAIRTVAATDWPTLGLLSPVDSAVPPEAAVMYPRGVRFRGLGAGLQRMTPQGYDEVIDRIGPLAQALAERGAKAILLTGTSLSFYRGATFNRELTRRMAAVSGRSAVTMSTAVVEGLRSVGGTRLAVATAYADEVNQRLRTFLLEEGFDVVAIQGLGITNVDDIQRVTQSQLMKFCLGLAGSARGANALLVSCGGLRTLDLIAPLEAQTQMPVITSLPHALRAGVRLLGLSGRSANHGRLLSL